MPRTAEISRKTSESEIFLKLNLDGTGANSINTGVPFFDHMLTALSKHSLIDLEVKAKGDVHIDAHHTVEDTAIVFGQALKEALGDKKGIGRYGDATVPLDESLARAVVDVSGRAYFFHAGQPDAINFHRIGGHFTGSLIGHAFEAIAHNASITLHVDLIRGVDPHHIAESQFKAFARALRKAVELDPRVKGVPSTKGSL
ncbi:MAG: imidazoleglycerol-phosphate dehydratase HisB [Microbacteriaceae bacterium]|nr:imidazoleglycerol-phosphate dehydratase HisB [Microbacteriaceae bacterium]